MNRTNVPERVPLTFNVMLDWCAAVLLLCLLVYSLQSTTLSTLHIAASFCLAGACLLVVFGSGTQSSAGLIRSLQLGGIGLFAVECLRELEAQSITSFASNLPVFW